VPEVLALFASGVSDIGNLYGAAFPAVAIFETNLAIVELCLLLLPALDFRESFSSIIFVLHQDWVSNLNNLLLDELEFLVFLLGDGLHVCELFLSLYEDLLEMLKNRF